MVHQWSRGSDPGIVLDYHYHPREWQEEQFLCKLYIYFYSITPRVSITETESDF